MMSTDDEDLRALREFRRDLDEPPEGALVKGRYRLARSEYRTPARRRWMPAAGGAVAALAVIVGGAAALRHHPSGTAETSGAQVEAAPPKPVDLPVTPGTRAPRNAKVESDGGATHAKAVAAMDRLAGAGANAQPMRVPAGQVLYIKTYNLVEGDQSDLHEVWMDPATMVSLRIRRTQSGPGGSIDETSAREEIDQAAAQPAGMDRPTAQYLATLPADPDALIASWRQWAHTTYPGRDADGMIWKDAFELINYSEPFWTPQQRATVYRALAKMPDVKATGAKIDNRPYDLVCLDRDVTGGTVDCLLFDSAGGRYAGSAWPAKNLALNPGDVGLVDYGTQPRPAPAVKPGAGPKPSGSRPGK